MGAHLVLRQPIGEMERGQRSPFDEPFGVGAEVAPTERAIVREYERHWLQRAAGVIPAGEDGNLRQRRAPGVTRSALMPPLARGPRPRQIEAPESAGGYRVNRVRSTVSAIF